MTADTPDQGSRPQPAWLHLGLILLAVVLVALTALVSLRTTAELSNSIEWVSHTQTVRRLISETETALSQAHSDMRAYLLTGLAEWRESHLSTRQRLKESAETIVGMVVDSEPQTERALFLMELLDERIAVWDQAIATFNEAGEEQARAKARSMGGLGLLEALQVELAAMDQTEVMLHEARWEQLQSQLDQTRSTIIIANGFALVAGGLGLWLLRRSRRFWEQQPARRRACSWPT